MKICFVMELAGLKGKRKAGGIRRIFCYYLRRKLMNRGCRIKRLFCGSPFFTERELMKVTTLIENHTSRRDLSAQHGLSFLIEDGQETILFDAGNSGAVWDNAKKLGIRPEAVTCAVLSHSHYDHAGGLMEGVSRGLSCPLVVGEGFFR